MTHMTPRQARRAAPPRGTLVLLLAVLAVLAGCASAPERATNANAGGAGSAGTAAADAARTRAGSAADTPLRQANADADAIAAAAASRAGEPGAGEPPAAPLPRVRLDPQQDAQRVDLWQRVRAGMRIPDLDDELVRKWEAWYAGRPDYVQRMTERGGRYLFHIVEEVERRGMPTELALLPFVESAFNPRAVSSARASGMWQFMPGTGRDFELTQNIFRDERSDVLASTRAALDYLQQLYARFADWQLALAAYNWGPGNVQRAIARNQRAGLATDLSSLARLPQETREYVPKLQAVKNIVRTPGAFGLALPQLRNHPYFLSVAIERDIDIDVAARLAGLSVDEFKQLNPQHRKPVILAAGTPQLLLPYDSANRFLRELAVAPEPLATWTAWTAPRTVKVAEAAHLVGTNEHQLREVNQIPPRMLVKTGSVLLVPRSSRHDDDVPAHIADNATIALAPEAPPQRRVAFKAGRKGDSVAAVARRYRVPAARVAEWNGVGIGARFAPGGLVVVMVPARTAAQAAVRTAARSRTVQVQAKAAHHAGAKASGARLAAKTPVRKTASGRRAAHTPARERMAQR